MNDRFMRKSRACLPLLAGAVCLISACGQYGNLYLPEEQTTETSIQQTPETTDTGQEQQDKDPDEEQTQNNY